MTVVPPVLLVRMFGVPESVTLPHKLREEITFAAYGITWRVKKISRSDYILTAPLHTGRARFGNAKQIAEDVGRILETGAMPVSAERVS